MLPVFIRFVSDCLEIMSRETNSDTVVHTRLDAADSDLPQVLGHGKTTDSNTATPTENPGNAGNVISDKRVHSIAELPASASKRRRRVVPKQMSATEISASAASVTRTEKHIVNDKTRIQY